MTILELAKKHKFTICSGITCAGLTIGGIYFPYLFVGAGISLAVTVAAGIKEYRDAFPESYFVRQEIDARISEIARECEPGMIESLAVALVMQRQNDIIQNSGEGQNFSQSHEISGANNPEGFIPLFNGVRNSIDPLQNNDYQPEMEGSTVLVPRPSQSAV